MTQALSVWQVLSNIDPKKKSARDRWRRRQKEDVKMILLQKEDVKMILLIRYDMGKTSWRQEILEGTWEKLRSAMDGNFLDR